MIKSGDIVLTSGDLAHVSAVRDSFLSFEAEVTNATDLCVRISKAPTWVFLDWLLPEMSGLQLCGLLRDRIHDHPLHVTMILPEPDQRAQARALDAGADDYLIGPLTPAALVRRLRIYQPAAAARKETPAIQIGDLLIQPDSHLTRYKGLVVPLQSNEQRLLNHFARNPNRVFTRGELIGVLGKSVDVCDERTVDSWVSRLRRKLRSMQVPHLPRTVRSFGYVFDSAEA
ncbi:response regulator transcription factor [Novosphingobium sp. ST904]|uniref:response regulator transcription factor n=1 Tax=Novosphingobium sp. ST904 TaxID=1684385 RepID=UPI0006C8C02F|nr:response regulator transcription factor [Novosphingobium sp. ST904]TCM37120.1 two-component system phosphate regulon response regulator PhoB [Novosphingobium sp. ST904]